MSFDSLSLGWCLQAWWCQQLSGAPIQMITRVGRKAVTQLWLTGLALTSMWTYVTATSFILRLGYLLRLLVEKGCRQEWVEGKGGGTSPKSSSKNKEHSKFPSKNKERESMRPEVQVNPLAMCHDISQQALGLWCQKGAGTSRDADAHSHCSGWCHGLGLWWWDKGVWGGKNILRGSPGWCLRHQSVLPAVYLTTFAANIVQFLCLISSFPCLVSKLKKKTKQT